MLTFVSPSLFDVISVPDILRRARDVRADSKQSWPATRPLIAAQLPAGVTMDAGDGDPLCATPDGDRAAIGQRILRLYFCQLYAETPTAVDLRAKAWAVGGDSLRWSPAAMLVRWDPTFIGAMRGVYRGFYDGDDAAFVGSLARLDLADAAPLFRAHFGDATSSAITFDQNHFVSSFGAVFEHCKRAGVRLHPDFVVLGAYLGGLYDSLSQLGVPLDVAKAYRAATAS